MGKGDRKTKKGKRAKGSHGVTRPRKNKKVTQVAPKPKKATKSKSKKKSS